MRIVHLAFDFRGLASGEPDEAAQFVGDGVARPLKRVGNGLLADSQLVRDRFLRQHVSVVEVDDLLLAVGQDLDVIEQRLRHQSSLVDSQEVFIVYPSLLHRWQVRFEVAADLAAGSFKWAVLTEHPWSWN